MKYSLSSIPSQNATAKPIEPATDISPEATAEADRMVQIHGTPAAALDAAYLLNDSPLMEQVRRELRRLRRAAR